MEASSPQRRARFADMSKSQLETTKAQTASEQQHAAPVTAAQEASSSQESERAATRIEAAARGMLSRIEMKKLVERRRLNTRRSVMRENSQGALERRAEDVRKAFFAWVKHASWALLMLLLYCVVGGLFYSNQEPDWDGVDAVYFSVVSMSTVGYGDLSPSTPALRGFTLLWILLGIIFVFPAVAGTIGGTLNPLSHKGRVLLERLFPQVAVDLDGDGVADYYLPRHPLVFYSKGLLPSFLLNIVVQLLSAVVFTAVEPEWDYFTALYHCIVTATTVGYGDIKINTRGGKVRMQHSLSVHAAPHSSHAL